MSANAGELVRLFVRERVRSDIGDGKPREAVLMIHGRSVPVLAGMELKHGDYDWALVYNDADKNVLINDVREKLGLELTQKIMPIEVLLVGKRAVDD